MADQAHITVRSPINIAFVKYWGKVDEVAIVPTNNSFSLTLSLDPFCTTTSVTASVSFASDALWLNGCSVDLQEGGRLQNVLSAARRALPADSPHRRSKVHVVSHNNFPTAAGMASSAAGLSALAYALHTLFALDIDVSCLARIGSGSACRSCYGGAVEWVSGRERLGDPSVDSLLFPCSKAVQHRPAGHWQSLRVLCLVTKAEMKETSSTVGMRRAPTSPHFEGRVTRRVPEWIEVAKRAIDRTDFESFAAVTMADFDDFRAVCSTSEPPVDYWPPICDSLIALVRAFNDHHSRLAAAYTYDAGPNCYVFCEEEHVALLVRYLLHHLPTPAESLFFEDSALKREAAAKTVPLPESLLQGPGGFVKTPLSMLLQCSLGNGPAVLSKEAARSWRAVHWPSDA
ncbi:Diphosphomevalonate decarboxylase [Diplonema papillatum]|nr:Diphosphomevalonate decarboxylase [Diplonema papillatum]|eukprot:gene8640-13364_t